jgi:hypothetical protein
LSSQPHHRQFTSLPFLAANTSEHT